MGFMGQHLCRFRTTFVDTAVSKTSRIKGVTKRRQKGVKKGSVPRIDMLQFHVIFCYWQGNFGWNMRGRFTI